MLNIFSHACWPSFSSCGRAVLSINFGFRNGGEFCPLHLLAVRSRNQAGHFNLCTQVLCLQSSVQFSRSVMSDSLRPRESRHARPPCPSPTPGVHSNSRHRLGDAIQPSHPLSSPFPPALNLSQHQGLFKWVSSSHQMAKVLEFHLQHQSFRWIFRTDFL